MLNEQESQISLKNIAYILAVMAEKSENVYWLSSPDLKSIAYVSPAYEKIWGRSRESLYENPEQWIHYLHSDDAVNHHPIHALAQRLQEEGDKARYAENYRIIRPDGEVRWIADRGFPIYDDAGNCCGLTGIAIDVTNEKLIEIRLKQAKLEAEQMTRLKSEFIRNMEHDVRTPLSGIEGLANMLAMEEVDADKKESLDQIMRSARELRDYCNSILDFSQLAGGKLTVRREPFSVRAVVKRVISTEAPAAKMKNLRLSWHCAEDIPEEVMGDAPRIQQILINLMSNALKFTPKGEVSLTIKLQKSCDDKVQLAFIIKDTGIGIPHDKHEMIYEKFCRLSPSDTGEYDGVGLGLQIVKQFVNELGGSITLKSEVGQGSTFTCYFPFEPVAVAAGSEAVSS